MCTITVSGKKQQCKDEVQSFLYFMIKNDGFPVVCLTEGLLGSLCSVLYFRQLYFQALYTMGFILVYEMRQKISCCWFLFVCKWAFGSSILLKSLFLLLYKYATFMVYKNPHIQFCYSFFFFYLFISVPVLYRPNYYLDLYIKLRNFPDFLFDLDVFDIFSSK